jgi:hypothetical protein
MSLDLFKLIADHGIALAIAITVLFFGVQFASEKFRIWKQKQELDFVSDPMCHGFWKKSKYLLDYKIDIFRLQMAVYCPGRAEIFSDMLRIKVKNWEQGLREIMPHLEDKGKQEVAASFNDAILKLIGVYLREWESTGIPRLVIDKFNKWHDSHTNILFDSIDSIAKGTSYSSSLEMINVLLEINQTMLAVLIVDAENTLKELNGELSGVVYKGITLK